MKEGEGEGGRRLPRRQALLLLAGMPQVLLGLGSVGGGWRWEWEGMKEGRLREEVLPVVAGSITACWHLLNEGELEAVERTVGSYLPPLRRWAYEPSGVQREAANLAAQGCFFLRQCAYHRLRFQQELAYGLEGVELSRLANDPALLVKALTKIGLDYFHLSNYRQALQALEEASSLLPRVPQLLGRTVHTGLALAYARQGKTREALEQVSRAKAVGGGPGPGEEELPVYLQADEGEWRLILREGWVRLELSRHGEEKEHALEAERALAQIERWQGRIAVPERIRLEIVNRRGEAAIGRGELGST
jgi:tetratricopeptide (TPR) repeat protein